MLWLSSNLFEADSRLGCVCASKLRASARISRHDRRLSPVLNKGFRRVAEAISKGILCRISLEGEKRIHVQFRCLLL